MNRLIIIVTILILVDGFLQFLIRISNYVDRKSHNPYFSRWFSAICAKYITKENHQGHNPYFSRWFSAITNIGMFSFSNSLSQSLF